MYTAVHHSLILQIYRPTYTCTRNLYDNTWERTFSPGIECSINLAALERSQQWGSAARINQHFATPCEVGRHTSHPVHGTQDRWRSQSVSRLVVIRPLYYELYAHKVKVQLEYSPVIRAKYHWNKVDNTSIKKVSSEIFFFFINFVEFVESLETLLLFSRCTLNIALCNNWVYNEMEGTNVFVLFMNIVHCTCGACGRVGSCSITCTLACSVLTLEMKYNRTCLL